MSAQAIKPKLWTPATLADHLGVSRKWIYHRTQTNGPERIPHLKMASSCASILIRKPSSNGRYLIENIDNAPILP